MSYGLRNGLKIDKIKVFSNNIFNYLLTLLIVCSTISF